MKTHVGVLLLLGALFAIPWTALSASQTSEVLGGRDYYQRSGDWYFVENDQEYRVNPEVISVRFRGVETLSEMLDATSVFNLSERDTLSRLETLRSNRLGIHDLRITDGSDVFDVLETLRKSDLIDFAEENTFGHYGAIPNDSSFTQLWGLNNTGQTGGSSDADMDAPEAWDISVGDPSVIVAVLDSGTEYTHTDLADNMYKNTADPINGSDDDNNGFTDDFHGWDFFNGNNDPRGPFWHGTHVAGCVAATTNNGTGVAGLGGGFNGNDGLRVWPIGVGDNFPDGSILDDAIIYSADMGCQVITLSLTVGSSSAIDAALDYAYNTVGAFIDCAAGNGGGSVSYPATNSNVMAVAATNHFDNRAGFSNVGSALEVSAPGEDILSTQNGNSYASSSGTSFAAPYVAALAGLILSVAPGLPNTAVRQVLQETCDDIEDPGFDNETGWGRINAFEALNSVASTDPPIINSLSPDCGRVNGPTSVTISGENFVGAVSVTFDGQPANFVTVLNDTTVIAGCPTGTVMESIDVSLTSTFGTDTVVNGFTYMGTVSSFGTPSIGTTFNYSPNGIPNSDWGLVIDYVAGMKVKKGMNFRINFSPDWEVVHDSFRTADNQLNGFGQSSAQYFIPDDPGLIGQPLYAEAVFDGNGPAPGRDLQLGKDRVDDIIVP